MRGVAAIVAACLWAGGAQAQSTDPHALRIAGLSLGMDGSDLSAPVERHGFVAQPVATDAGSVRREGKRSFRAVAFRREDGHALTVEVEREGTPLIRHLGYDMGRDADTSAMILKHIRSLYGPPQAVHGSEGSLQMFIWEVPGTDMNIDGLLTTSVVLVADPAEGHRLTIGEVRKKPEFGGNAARSAQRRASGFSQD